MKKAWIFAINQFLNVVKSNFIKGMQLSTYHDGALLTAKATDPFFIPLYDAYHPLHLALENAFQAWVNQGGSQQGQTLNLSQLFKQLGTTKITAWTIAVQVVYLPDSPEYKAIFPSGRAPFQKGKQSDKINAVGALKLALTGIAPLAATLSDVDAFFTLLNNTNTNQKGSKTATKTLGDTVKNAAIATAVEQYGNLGLLMNKFKLTPENIENYFDVNALRRKNGGSVTGGIAPLTYKSLFQHTFHAGDIIKITNDGDTALEFYLALTNNSAPLAPIFTVEHGTFQLVDAAYFGNLVDNKFFSVNNNNPVMSGHYKVELM